MTNPITTRDWICRVGIKGGMWHNSQSNDVLQHHDSTPDATSNRHALDAEDGSFNCVTKNRSLVSPVYCTQEPGQEPPGSEAGTIPCVSQQDSECSTNEEKTLEKEVLVLMQALSTLSTPEEKLAVLCMKYTDRLEDISNVEKQRDILRWKQVQITKEKVQLQIELIEVALAREKLESLCKALQHQKKWLKEEKKQQSREKESRERATSYFQFTLNEIQAQLQQYEMHNTRLQQKNTELGEKVKKLTEQYTLRKKQIDSETTHKELQEQLVKTKFHQRKTLIKEADKKHQRERAFLLTEAAESRCRYEEKKQLEAQLKQQLSLHMDKIEECQNIMKERIEVFTSFRQETEERIKKSEKLEKEVIDWRIKWESNSRVLLEMAEEKIILDKQHQISQMKLKRLEKLFTALEVKRNKLKEKVKVMEEQVSRKATGVNSATPVTQPCIAPESPKESGSSLKEGQESTCRLSTGE